MKESLGYLKLIMIYELHLVTLVSEHTQLMFSDNTFSFWPVYQVCLVIYPHFLPDDATPLAFAYDDLFDARKVLSAAADHKGDEWSKGAHDKCAAVFTDYEDFGTMRCCYNMINFSKITTIDIPCWSCGLSFVSIISELLLCLSCSDFVSNTCDVMMVMILWHHGCGA